MENTIILCVAPATTPRLTSYIPISMIKKHNKCDKSMLALTMCDRVQEEDVFDLIVKRLINQSDELNGLNFVDCVGVVNRSNNNINLCDNEKKEKKWFEENVIENMPEDFENEEKLIDSMGSEMLVNNIIDIYNKYIESSWVPKTITMYENELKNANEKLNNIGPETCPEVISQLFATMTNEVITPRGRPNRYSMRRCLESTNFDNNIITNLDHNVQKYVDDVITSEINIVWTNIKQYLEKAHPEHKFKRFTSSIINIVEKNELLNIEKLYEYFKNSNDTIKNYLLYTYDNNYCDQIFASIFGHWIKNISDHEFDYSLIKEDNDSVEQRNIIKEHIERIKTKINKLYELMNNYQSLCMLSDIKI